MNLAELASKIRASKVKFKVVALPDFFIDHFLVYPSSLENLIEEMREVAKRGGGNIFKCKHYFLRGGCAANFAAAISNLGVDVKLITKTSIIGLKFLEVYAPRVDLSHVKVVDDQAVTLALEVEFSGRRVNIMMSNPGPVKSFRFEDLSEDDLEEIASADFTAIFTWNANDYGTELAEKAFSYVKECGCGRTYMDLGDPTAKREELKELIERILRRGLLDALSLNENELVQLAKSMNVKFSGDLIDLARKISLSIPVRIDLHTANFSASFIDGDGVMVPSFKVEVLRSTGAGDAWNAGNIYGWGCNFNFEERLLIANAVAAYYISNKKAIHPSLIDLVNFIRKRKLRLTPC